MADGKPGPLRGRTFWTLLSYGGLVGALLLLLGLALGSQFVVSAHRVLEETRDEWIQSSANAVLSLERYWILGEPEFRESYEEALAVPARIRPALRHARAHPGETEQLRRLLERGVVEPRGVEPLVRFGRWLGDHDRTLRILDLSLEADELLLRVDSLATAMTEAGLPGALADPDREELLREALERLHVLDREMDRANSALGDELRGWSRDLETLVRRALLGGFGLVLLGGLLVVRTASRHISGADRAVRESERRFRQLAEAIHEVFWLTPPDKSEMLYVSPAYERIWERPVEELYRRPTAWLEAIHPEDRERVREALPLQARGEFDLEYRILTPSGGIRWIRDRGFPVRDDDGEVVRVAGVAGDITAKKELEEEMLRGRHRRSVGRLAAGVAHRFNNLLTVIQGQIQLLRMDRPDDPELEEELEPIQRATTAARDLTRELLAFGREQVLVPRPVCVASFVEESRDLIDAVLPANVELETELAPTPPAHVDPAQLRESLLHLGGSARELLPEGGTITLRTGSLSSRAPVPVEGGELPPGRWVTLELAGSEGRFPPGLRERMLDPFGGAPTEGGPAERGLGLASLHGFLDQSGGGVRIEESEESGIRVVLFLPEARDPETGEERAESPGGKAASNTGTVDAEGG